MGKVFLFQTVNRVTVTPLFRTKKMPQREVPGGVSLLLKACPQADG